jgi:hypothetical protein
LFVRNLLHSLLGVADTSELDILSLVSEPLHLETNNCCNLQLCGMVKLKVRPTLAKFIECQCKHSFPERLSLECMVGRWTQEGDKELLLEIYLCHL